MRAYALCRFDIRTIPDEFGKHQLKTSFFEYLVVHFWENVMYPTLRHSFNVPSGRRRFFKSVPDAWLPSSTTTTSSSWLSSHGGETSPPTKKIKMMLEEKDIPTHPPAAASVAVDDQETWQLRLPLDKRGLLFYCHGCVM